MEGLGELDIVRVIDWAVPLVRVTVTVDVMDDPATMDALAGLTDNV
jgi:hypothetical protein